jgi:transposase InsO family protein
MCRAYGVSRAGYYAYARRAPSARMQKDVELAGKIEKIHQASHGTYGSPRITEALRHEGETIGKHRVARLMQQQQIKARTASLYLSHAALKAFYLSVPNRQLEVAVTQPDQVWVGDITYLKVGKVWRYLAVIMDKCSRQVLGWGMSTKRDAKLTINVLNAAVRNRKPPAGLIFHTDRGIEYSSHAFRNRLAYWGITQSMNRPGRMTDNAHMESFFHSMKSDVYHGRRFGDELAIKKVVKRYMPFYHEERLHSSLNYVSPKAYEKMLSKTGVY